VHPVYCVLFHPPPSMPHLASCVLRALLAVQPHRIVVRRNEVPTYRCASASAASCPPASCVLYPTLRARTSLERRTRPPPTYPRSCMPLPPFSPASSIYPTLYRASIRDTQPKRRVDEFRAGVGARPASASCYASAEAALCSSTLGCAALETQRVPAGDAARQAEGNQ
jgi:hypothetical protein